MNLILFLSGLSLIVISIVGKKLEHVSETESNRLKIKSQEVEVFQSDFHKQFEISQKKLESLYVLNLDEINQKLNQIDVQLNQINERLIKDET